MSSTSTIAPRERMLRSFEKNRLYFEQRRLRQGVDWNKALLGEICFMAINGVITCSAAGRTDLAATWLEDARYLIEESISRTHGRPEIDGLDLTRIDVTIAGRVEKLLRREAIDRSPVTPYEAFDTFLSSASEVQSEDQDCAWLMWGLSATLENQRARYEELRTRARRRPHRELVRERELLDSLGALLEGSVDDTFWKLYREVLMRWLDPALATKSEAFLYRDAIRYLLALNWMVFKLRSERRDDFLEVMYGNVSG